MKAHIKNIFFHNELNSPLVVFRIFFGLLMLLESWGSILTGWVVETFIKPAFTFSFFGFEWTSFLLGPQMYVYYMIMGVLGLCIMLGYRYKLSIVLFAILWSITYFMQKEHYNNHYYLVMLISWFMAITPAHKFYSLDVYQGRVEEKRETYALYRYWFICQIFLVYTYAAVAKIYPGWFNGDFLSIRLNQSASWFKSKTNSDFIYKTLTDSNLHTFMAYAGFFFDLLVVPLILYKPTRWFAIIASLTFHLFNSVTLHIGIFPYFALSMIVFFFPPEKINQFFFRKVPSTVSSFKFVPPPMYSGVWVSLFILYFIWQIYLPLRHYHIPGDVLWTEEGHKLSWRMMLRSKGGYINFKVVDAKSGKEEHIDLSKYLSDVQLSNIATKPDMIYAFAKRLKKEYAQKGKEDVKIYANSQISINGSPYYPYIIDTIDIGKEKWNYFGHQRWIMPAPKDFNQ